MKKILHITASPRKELSRTLRIADALLARLKKIHGEISIDTLDVFTEKLPEMNIARLGGKYTLMSGEELSGDAVSAWDEILAHIERFLAADIIVISTPMWNFGVPYRLKQYIDVVWQPRYLFKYTENGVVGLAAGRKAYVISSRGSDYTPGTPGEALDQLVPYMRTILTWAGIEDIAFVSAYPMDANTAEGREAKIKETIASLDNLS